MGSNINRDEFLEIGSHCSDKSCNQLDFLPFKCPSCTLSFCSVHWKPTDHSCLVYDPIIANNLIPTCPLCSIPIPYPPKTDPNISMESHLSSTCSVLFPNAKITKSGTSTPICCAKKCSVKMVVPILCKSCKKKYCFKHRFEGDHACVPVVVVGGGKKVVAGGKGKAVVGGGGGLKKVVSRTSSSNATASTSKSTLPITKPQTKPKPIITKSNSKSSTSQSTTASIAASAAEARLLSSSSASNSKASTSKSGLGTKSNPIIISDSSDEEEDVKVLSMPKRALIALTPATKVDKRSEQERISARRALEMRASRGLLSKTEEMMYAEMQALEAAAEAGKKSSCSMS